MDVPIRHRMRRSVNLDTFTDELHADVGSSSFCLAELKEATGHDYFTQQDLVIRTASGGGGTLLIENTDYTLSEENTTYSTLAENAAGTTKNVYKKITITNATYQSGDLYFSGKYFTDYADPYDLNNIIVKCSAKAADFTISDYPGYQHYNVTTGASAIVATLPDAETNIDIELTFMKIDDGAGVLAIVPSGSDAIIGMTTSIIIISEQYGYVTLKSTGSEWIVIKGKIGLDSGYIGRSDWANVHIGFVTLNYTGKSDTFKMGGYVTEATSGNKGILIYDSGTAFTLVNISEDGSGFTNGRTITSDNGETATINGNTKDVDSNAIHRWGISMDNIATYLFSSTDGTDNNSFEFKYYGDTSKRGLTSYQVDSNSFFIQTSLSSPVPVAADGDAGSLGDDFYKLKIYYISVS